MMVFLLAIFLVLYLITSGVFLLINGFEEDDPILVAIGLSILLSCLVVAEGIRPNQDKFEISCTKNEQIVYFEQERLMDFNYNGIYDSCNIVPISEE